MDRNGVVVAGATVCGWCTLQQHQCVQSSTATAAAANDQLLLSSSIDVITPPDSNFAHAHAPAHQAFAHSYGGKEDEWKLCKGYCQNRGDCYIVKEKYWHDRLLSEDTDRDLLSALEDVDELDERGLIEAAEFEERGLIEEDAEAVERDLKGGKDNWKYKKYHKKYYHEKKKP
eukprot:15446-Heterococcus_DN1.PRE.3